MADFLVLGAGIVGVSTALALQERGHDVALIDRRAPGMETSYGNAGVIQTEAVAPYAMPLKPSAIWEILRNRSNDVRWEGTALGAQLNPLARYVWHSLPHRHQRQTEIYARLIKRAGAAHEALISAAGLQDLISTKGHLELYRDGKQFDESAAEAERLLKEFDLAGEIQDGAKLGEIEPCLAGKGSAIWWRDTLACHDPQALVQGYADLFTSRGGRIVHGDVGDLKNQGASWSAAGESAENAVIALGPWSRRLVIRFGMRAPMILKRGYHRHYDAAQIPSRPVVDMVSSAVFAPMSSGLRVLTGAELSHKPREEPPQMAIAEEVGRELFGLGASRDPRVWTGLRPCMADMLPVIGAVPGHSGLWTNFGHGHQGFTLGPVSGELLADAVEGHEVRPLSAARLAG